VVRAKTSSSSGNRKRPRAARTEPSTATIDHVAGAARVSTATVSRFFNAPALVSKTTAQRVRAAVERFGYVPNMMAGGLASSRSRLVAAVIPAISQSIFSSTIQALTDSLAEVGYTVILGLTGAADEHAQRQLLSIIGRRPDGIILTGSRLEPATRRQLKATRIPTIETWDLPRSPVDLVVGFSHAAVGAAVARRALSQHRRRALVVSATGKRALTRLRSFSHTMEESGAPPPESVMFDGTTSFGQGRRAMASHLDQGGRPDMVVCSSDWSAHGALDELHRRGIRVPDDIAVVGFGDLDFAADLNPPLTTVRIDGAVIGRQASTFLMQRARGETIEKPIVDIGFSLIVRSSG
jgi:LacI family gluconate utilization system Gnt-I transcriptional repressor